MATNPPVPATPLDVEACVRLLTLLARDSAEDAAKADREYAMADKNTQWAALALKNRDRCYAEQALLGALASALPGMGKDSERIDWFEVNAFNAGFHDGACEVLDADGNEWRANTFREAVDRAAQPQETSADEV